MEAGVDLRITPASGVSKHTSYGQKTKCGVMEVSEAQAVKQLREENARLKRLGGSVDLGQRHAASS